ncbi:MAG: lamin tail domain-containing protein [Bacteroidales bacterium]|nr:lamin tail domain-containing protein [Bacteroidales bacterium]MCF8343522.1 lamin tail domain-containing protein [Bacteroidales bacterium]MCF8349813.1 lamin tail domain-containing protein [Bacteroidales bacterium]MCF8375933.1 lamin tail domain-containing protein [Bacteroidales bacterium]
MRNYRFIKPVTAVCLFLLLFFPAWLNAQLNDDFSDGNFTQNPEWTGNSGDFTVNGEGELQLDAEASGVSWMSTTNKSISDTEWRFMIRLSFSPSANNNARVYLVSDSQDMTAPLNGYFLQFGESGSDDAIELFRQNDDEISPVCRGTDGLISSSFMMFVKVIHSSDGNWEIYIDPEGSGIYQPEASGTDHAIGQSEYFGLLCNYTSSNSTKMYFDDFYVGPVQIDTLGPQIQNLEVVSMNEIQLGFSEAVDEITAENIQNYFLSPGGYNPEQAVRNADNPARVNLSFDENFMNGQKYLLNIKNVEDLAGNPMENQELEFSHYKAGAWDVVINEIMADPTPPIALPEYEYIELANNTSNEIDLSGWTLTIGSSEKEFGRASIAPDNFLILARESAESELSALGDFYGFSSFSITNAGQSLELRNEEGKLISFVSFMDNWYRDPEKNEGGWSLEQIDRFNPCIGSANWKASERVTGGTPGEENSVLKSMELLPEVEFISFIDDKTFEISFSQSMDSLSIGNPTHYAINNGIGPALEADIQDIAFSRIRLIFDKALKKGIIYELRIRDTLYNCSGLPLFPIDAFQAGIPEIPGERDVVINEILFDPVGNGVDYLEIFNKSQKIIDLSRIAIGEVQESFPDPPDTNLANISYRSMLLFPQEYLLLTKNPETVKAQFFTTNPSAFVQVESFPEYNKDKGQALLIHSESVLDKMEYNQDMQNQLLNFFEGVALERVNPSRPSSDQTNWHSAAETIGFGTPGYENSQFVEDIEVDDPIVIEPDLFSPDGDGQNDLLNIHYEFDQPGKNISILIFDDEGREVKNLVNNKSVGVKGFFSWDGVNENKEKAGIGIYVILVKVFDAEGNVSRYKKAAVLGGYFK